MARRVQRTEPVWYDGRHPPGGLARDAVSARRNLAWSTIPAMRLMVVTLAAAALMSGTSAWAQAPAEPKIWTVNASAGLALTSGNKNTSTLNAAYDLTFDPQTRNVVKSDALLIRGKTDGELTASRFSHNVRDEFTVNGRTFVFGQHQYLRDEFKSIDYLLAPTGGVGLKVFDTMQTKLAVDVGAGGVWEKNPGFDLRSSGAVVAGEKLTQTLTATTMLTQSVAALWKTKNWDDALYVFGVGVAASISARTQLKVEVIDVYKNLPPLPTIEKNDVAVLMAIVYKM
jgi:putative salt-induced outer membrane protein YdiY